MSKKDYNAMGQKDGAEGDSPIRLNPHQPLEFFFANKEEKEQMQNENEQHKAGWENARNQKIDSDSQNDNQASTKTSNGGGGGGGEVSGKGLIIFIVVVAGIIGSFFHSNPDVGRLDSTLTQPTKISSMVEPAAVRERTDRQEALAIIEKAIQAHGGAENITKFRTCKWEDSFSGRNENGVNFNAISTYYFQSPDKIRMDMKIIFGETVITPGIFRAMVGQKTKRIKNEAIGTYCVSENTVWATIATDSGTQEISVPEEMAKNLYGSFYLMECCNPVSLLENDFKLKISSSQSLGSENCVAIEIQKQGKPDVNLFFDKKSNLLVGLEYDRQIRGNSAHIVICYSQFQKFSGIIQPTIAKTFRDGVLKSNVRTAWITPVDFFPNSVFIPPVWMAGKKIGNP